MKRTMWAGSVCAAACCLAGAAFAEVVAWWRFDTIGDDNKVVNAANPGTYDGWLTTGSAAGTDGTWPADAANMPVATDAFAQSVPRVVDPLTGVVTNGGKALHWNGTAVKGGVVVPYEDAEGLLLEKFTVEAFVRLPPGAATRSNQMFPILHFGNDSGTGFMFSAYDNSMGKGYLFFREEGSAWEIWKNQAADMPGLYDGRWHHVAATFNGNLATGKATMILYQDGMACARYANVNWGGWASEKTARHPLVIGRHLYQASRTFMGEIAEVRISDAVLTENQFLAPLADRPGLVDGDTAAMITFDSAKKAGVGPASQHLVPCVNGSTTNYVWVAQNWNIQNAATNRPLVPRWFSFVDVKGRDTYLGDALRPLLDEETLPGEGLYGSAFGTAPDAEGASMKFSRNGGAWADLVNVPGASGLVADSLTVELFFKTDIADNDTDTLVYAGFLKWCVYQGQLLARTFTQAGQNSGTGHVGIQSSAKVNDGAWHHAAYVYDKASGTVAHYLDYVRLNSRAVVPYVDGSLPFLIGGETRNNQTFAGNIDDVRITRRALKPWEFLATHAEASGRIMDAQLESDYASGVDAAIAPGGTAGTLAATADSGAAEAPSIVKTREGFVTLDGEAGEETRASGHALRLDGGYVRWPNNRLLDRQDLTLEFFARLDRLEHSANLVRLSSGTAVFGNPLWTLWWSSSYGMTVSAYTTADGGVTTASVGAAFHKGAEDDGKWHHWAMTAEANDAGDGTVFTLYKDYVRYGDAVAVSGLLRLPSQGANLSVGGTSVAGAFVHGLVNNLRISPGVLPASAFMRFVPKAGTWLIIR